MKITGKDVNGLKGRVLRASLLFLSMACLIGLSTSHSFAQSTFAIDYLASERSHTATMEIHDKAENVWQSVVDIAKKRNPNNLKIREENKEKLTFKATKITDNGEELWASLKVRPVSETSCRLVFTATMGGGKPLEKYMKDFVQDTLLQFCDEKKLTCSIVK